MCRSLLVPSLLATKNGMLLNTDLRWHGHYHSYQITGLEQGLGKNTKHTNPKYLNPNNFANLFVGLFCKLVIPMASEGIRTF